MGVDEQDLVLQRLRPRQALLHQREDTLARGGQAHTAAAAHQHGEAHILFQTVHHVGQAGLGIAQLLRRAGEAAQPHRRRQGRQLFRVHSSASHHDELS